MDTTLGYLDNTVNSVRSNLDSSTQWMEDQTIVNLITLALVVYSAMFVGKVWPRGMELFKHPLVKILVFLGVAYVSTRNVALAFVAMIAVFAIMMTNLKNTKEFLPNDCGLSEPRWSTDDDVYRAMMGGCICNCDGVRCSCKCGGMGGIKSVEQVEGPEDIDPEEALVEEEQAEAGRPEGQVEAVDNKQMVAEVNQQALDNVRRQMLAHDRERDSQRLVNGDIGSCGSNGGRCGSGGCGDSPYRRSSTPFGRHKVMEDVFANVNIDSDFAPLNFS